MTPKTARLALCALVSVSVAFYAQGRENTALSKQARAEAVRVTKADAEANQSRQLYEELRDRARLPYVAAIGLAALRANAASTPGIYVAVEQGRNEVADPNPELLRTWTAAIPGLKPASQIPAAGRHGWYGLLTVRVLRWYEELPAEIEVAWYSSRGDYSRCQYIPMRGESDEWKVAETFMACGDWKELTIQRDGKSVVIKAQE